MTERRKFFIDFLTSLAKGMFILTLGALGYWDTLTKNQIDLLIAYPTIALGLYSIAYLILEDWAWRYYE